MAEPAPTRPTRAEAAAARRRANAARATAAALTALAEAVHDDRSRPWLVIREGEPPHFYLRRTPYQPDHIDVAALAVGLDKPHAGSTPDPKEPRQ